MTENCFKFEYYNTRKLKCIQIIYYNIVLTLLKYKTCWPFYNYLYTIFNFFYRFNVHNFCVEGVEYNFSVENSSDTEFIMGDI